MQQTLAKDLLGELMYKGSGGPAILLCVPRWETLLPCNHKLADSKPGKFASFKSHVAIPCLVTVRWILLIIGGSYQRETGWGEGWGV
jgi:hypothetical protein